VATYCFGIATGHYRIFPFSFLFNLKKEAGLNVSKRNLNIDSFEEVEVSASKETGIY
jgi:hypothetical protein